YKVANAPVQFFPYPHIYVQDVFPAQFYSEIQQNLPDPALMIPIEEARPVKGYKERFVMEIGGKHTETLAVSKKEFWTNFSTWLLNGRFMNLMLQRFGPFV